MSCSKYVTHSVACSGIFGIMYWFKRLIAELQLLTANCWIRYSSTSVCKQSRCWYDECWLFTHSQHSAGHRLFILLGLCITYNPGIVRVSRSTKANLEISGFFEPIQIVMVSRCLLVMQYCWFFAMQSSFSHFLLCSCLTNLLPMTNEF